MEKAFKISKEEFYKQKGDHLYYLNSKNYPIELPEAFFNYLELEDIRKYGYWYEALESGLIKPITTKQDFFKKDIIENSETSSYGKAWIKYRYIQKGWGDIYRILKAANTEELKNLSEILGSKCGKPADLILRMQSLSNNILHKIDRSFFDETDNMIPYSVILLKIFKKLKIEGDFHSHKEAEHLISLKVLNTALDKMIDQEKMEIEKELRKAAEENGEKLYVSGAILTGLGAAQLSGFGVYMLASSALSFLGGIMGATFAFHILCYQRLFQ